MSGSSNEISALKEEMRRAVRAPLALMGTEERAARSRDLCAALERAAAGRGVVMVFLPDGHEPMIDGLISSWIAGGRVVAAPRCDWDAGIFTVVRLRSLGATEVRRNGVREPVAGEEIPVQSLAFGLVPGVAFDAGGGRLGRGGGFYDRFLGSAPATMRRVGVCYAAQMVARVPREEHDAVVDVVVTESRTFLRGLGEGGGRMDR